MSNLPFDDAAHKKAVRMLRFLTRQRLDQLSKPGPVPAINYHARALEQSSIALTACHVTASSGIGSLEPQFELHDSIDVDLPISLHLSPVKGTARVTFPLDRKRIIKVDVFDEEPLKFTPRPRLNEYSAPLTAQQVALLARALRLPPCYQHFADEQLAPTGKATLQHLIKSALTWAQAKILGQLLQTLKETIQDHWQLVNNLLLDVELQNRLAGSTRRNAGPASSGYVRQFIEKQELLIYVPAPVGPRQVLGTLWKQKPTATPTVMLQIDQGEPKPLSGDWDTDWRQFTLMEGVDPFGEDGQLSWAWQAEKNALTLHWKTTLLEASPVE